MRFKISVFGALLITACETGGPKQPAMVEIRDSQSESLPLNVGPGGCMPVWQDVKLHSGQEPVCLRGKLESVTVIWAWRDQVDLRVNCGCVP